jgi:RNA polymerase sigma factor (sigma-70 family)
MYKEEKTYIRRTRILDGDKHYYVSFEDAHGKIIEVEVSQDVYDAIHSFQRIEAKLAREDRRHIEYFCLADDELDRRAVAPFPTTEEIALKEERLAALDDEIEELSDIQQRRFYFYFVQHLSYRQIAEIEGCERMSVKDSIDIARKKLRSLKNIFDF